MTEWQPIETAPKDGRILVCTGEREYVAEWQDFKNSKTSIWNGWFVATNDTGGCGSFVAPTHWMPLPESPHE
jgi:hypothetical protein